MYKVLGKADFKHLLKWRLKMIGYQKLLQQSATKEEPAGAISVENVKDDAPTSEKPDSETMIREELSQMRANTLAKKKREKKKVRNQTRTTEPQMEEHDIPSRRVPVVLVTSH